MPAFKEVLTGLANAWKNEKDEVDKVAERAAQHLQSETQPHQRDRLTKESLVQAAKSLLEGYDWDYGGWGAAPSFCKP